MQDNQASQRFDCMPTEDKDYLFFLKNLATKKGGIEDKNENLDKK